MKSSDQRVIWKEKTKISVAILITDFIEKNGVTSARSYQHELKKHPQEVPSLWFITEMFGSWEKLLVLIGKVPYDRYRWEALTDDELEELVTTFNKENNILSQRSYEKNTVGENMPSLSTLRKRFEDIRFLFRGNRTKSELSDFEQLALLKTEIIKLNLEKSLSMTEFRKKCSNPNLPSVDTIMRRTNKNWEELMSEIGFDYRKIKIEKLTKNFR